MTVEGIMEEYYLIFAFCISAKAYCAQGWEVLEKVDDVSFCISALVRLEFGN